MMKKITLLFVILTAYVGYAQPTTNAPTPTNSASDVISIYSDSYTNIATNYNPGWGQTGTVNTTYDPTGGGTNFVMAYTNFNYQGTDLTATNMSAMEYVHIDLWTAANPANSIIQVSPINHGTGPVEVLVTINYTSGSWTSVDIPKSSFTGMTWDNVDQFKFAANGAGSTVPIDIYVDNVYFWKTAASPTTDATLSDLQVDGATISGFSPATTSYTYTVPTGTTVVPQITSVTATQAGNGSSATSITQASAIPGDATVLVTAPDGTTTKTYTVSIVATGPSTAAPTPPARNASDVISLYSDAYTDVASTFDAGWCNANSVEEVLVAGNKTMHYLGNACQGIVLDTGVDASTFTNLHVDIYIESGTDLTSSVFNLKFVQQPGGAALEINLNAASSPALVAGSWLSVDVPVNLSTFTGFKEFGITSNLNNIVWYDNLYTYKGTPLSTKAFAIEGLKVYPNPAKDNWTVSTKNIKMTSIQVFDILGKNVLSLRPNTSEAKINGANLRSGLYFAKISTVNGASTLKLVKE